MTTLRRYWFELDLRGYSDPPPGVRMGCGVSAYSDDDARLLLKQKVFADRALPPLAKAVEDIDVSTLDAGHVIPNMGLVTVRGVWFPLGYA